MKYLIVAIKSLICNASKDFNYDIYILQDDVSDEYKNIVKKMQKQNVRINFVNFKECIKDFDESNFFVWRHFSVETYYRFFITRIFKNFKKVLYIDCDTLIADDIAKLYNIDLNDKPIGASKDFIIKLDVLKSRIQNKKNYFADTLNLNNVDNYFQAGVLILDIPKLIEMNSEEKFIATLHDLKNPQLVDQDVLNKVLENNVEFIPVCWDVLWNVPIDYPDFEKLLSENLSKEFRQAFNKPKIIHYAGSVKPWNSLFHKKTFVFWKYAFFTPVFINLVRDLVCINLKKIDLIIKIYSI